MEDWVKKLFKRGTPQCGLAYGVIAFMTGLLLVLVGFWKTFFIAVLCAIGVFLGCNHNYEQAVKNGINQMLPKEKNHVKDITSREKEENEISSKEEEKQ